MFLRFCRIFVSISKSFFKMPFYAVRTGHHPGVYKTWDECKAEVASFPRARYKKFETEIEALQFVTGFDNPGDKQSGKGKGKAPDKTDLKNADKKIEDLEERLALAKKEKSLIEKETELEGKVKGKRFSAPRSTPYSKPETASSSAWKQDKVTKPLDLDSVKQLHTDAHCGKDSGVVYVDGACFNNGAHGASAGIGVYWGPDHSLNTSERLPGRQTNNRAEIHAAIRAIQQAKKKGMKELTIKTDSIFLIKSMTEWLTGWKKKGWVTAAKNPVKNKEDFVELDEVQQGITINWEHVPGHKGIEGNERADKLAVAGAKLPQK